MNSEELERRLWAATAALGGATPRPGLEAVHRYAELAACHFAACRQLQAWGSNEACARHVEACEAIDAARAAFPSQADPVRRELAALANQLARTGPPCASRS